MPRAYRSCSASGSGTQQSILSGLSLRGKERPASFSPCSRCNGQTESNWDVFSVLTSLFVAGMGEGYCATCLRERGHAGLE
eukprot:1161380-Pelagomonas_calceolata.AAC.4